MAGIPQTLGVSVAGVPPPPQGHQYTEPSNGHIMQARQVPGIGGSTWTYDDTEQVDPTWEFSQQEMLRNQALDSLTTAIQSAYSKGPAAVGSLGPAPSRIAPATAVTPPGWGG